MVQQHISDTSLLISNAIKENKSILFEGAQGTLLDIDHGTYPFVTSSNTTEKNFVIRYLGAFKSLGPVPPYKRRTSIESLSQPTLPAGPFEVSISASAGTTDLNN